MKLKKALTSIVAIAMAGAMAMSASATETIKFDGVNNVNARRGNLDWVEFHVAGSSVDVDKKAISLELIRGIKFTFDLPDHICGPSDEDPEAVCNKECVGIAWNDTDSDWVQEYFCYKEYKGYIVDLTEHRFVPGPDEDTPGTGLGWLRPAAALWVPPANSGSIKVEILGENSEVLVWGQEELRGDGTGAIVEDFIPQAAAPAVTTPAPAATTTPAAAATTPAPATTGGTGGGDSAGATADTKDVSDAPKTGATGIVVLGGAALLAAGAVAVTRKRK
jgi:hypothetical protein